MDYQKIYNCIIERGKNRELDCYAEEHHIIPRCIGGTDDPDNLVNLTPEEHYVAHQLLAKLNPGCHNLERGAATMTIDSNGERVNNKLYGWIRRRLSIIAKEQAIEQWKNPDYRLKMSEIRKEYWKNSENRIKTIKAMKKAWENPKLQAKQSASIKEYFKDPKNRIKQSIAIKKYLENPENRIKHAAAIKEAYKDPDLRMKKSESMKKYLKNPENRDKMAAAIKKKWEDPEYRSKLSAKKKGRIWITNGIQSKQVYVKNNKIPEGWVRGRKQNNDQQT